MSWSGAGARPHFDSVRIERVHHPHTGHTGVGETWVAGRLESGHQPCVVAGPDDQSDRLSGLSKGARRGLHGGIEVGHADQAIGSQAELVQHGRPADGIGRVVGARRAASSRCTPEPPLRSPGPIVLTGDDRARHLKAGADAKVGPVLRHEVRAVGEADGHPLHRRLLRRTVEARPAEDADRAARGHGSRVPGSMPP